MTGSINPMRRSMVALVVLAVVVGACGTNRPGGSTPAGPGSQAPAVSAPASVSGTLTVWAMGNEGVKLKDLATKFEQDNPGTTINVTPVDWGVAVDKLQTAIAGHQTPDVSQMGTDMMGQFGSIPGALEPVPANFQPSTFFESAWNTNIVNGTVLGVPWYVETRMLYYRKDIAEKAGITDPPANWDELKTMAQALKEKGGAKYGISLAPNNWQELMPFIWQKGGEVVDDNGQFTFDTPEVVDALKYEQSFFKEGLTAPSVPEGFDVTQGFIAGTHPMFFSGPWHMSLIEDQGGAKIQGKWAIAPMPKEETGTSFVGGSDLVVFKNSENKDAAWQFVQYLLDPETQAKWYQTVSDLPSEESAWDLGSLGTDDNLQIFRQQLGDAKSPPPIPKWEQIASEVINTEMEKALTGGESAEQAAKNMQEKATSIGSG
jgi:multiple sugar transport system substrate-binding protein